MVAQFVNKYPRGDAQGYNWLGRCYYPSISLRPWDTATTVEKQTSIPHNTQTDRCVLRKMGVRRKYNEHFASVSCLAVPARPHMQPLQLLNELSCITEI